MAGQSEGLGVVICLWCHSWSDPLTSFAMNQWTNFVGCMFVSFLKGLQPIDVQTAGMTKTCHLPFPSKLSCCKATGRESQIVGWNLMEQKLSDCMRLVKKSI